jgi:hypothetical protein
MYAFFAVISVGLTAYFFYHQLAQNQSTWTSLLGLTAGFLVTPMIPKHLQRSSAAKILEHLKAECALHNQDDPECKRISDNVDAILRARGGTS